MKRTTITLICIALFFVPEFVTPLYIRYKREQQREQLMRYNETYEYLGRGLKP